jgi:N-acyl homoserine lactone hydrolase
MSTMKIYAIQTGTVAIKTKQQVGKGSGPFRQINMLLDNSWTPFLPIYAWVIEHPEGVIVIDTGETARTAQAGYFPKWHPYYKFGVRMKVLPEQEIGPQLRALGITPHDVKKVILTHFHTDHAGGLSHFPSSEILVSNADYRAASTLAGQLSGYLPQHWPDWFNPTPIRFEPAALEPFKNTYRVTDRGDVIVVPTPGHTAAHVSVIARDDEGYVFLAGDTSYTEQAVIERQVDGVSPDVNVALQTIDNILQFSADHPTVYLPSHDPNAIERLQKRQTLVAASRALGI